MNIDLQQALNYDSIADAEKITGKSWKEDDSVAFLGMALMLEQNAIKDKLLSQNRDTNSWRQTVPEFFEILADIGFREVLKLPIEGTQDHFHVFWKPGLLLYLDTYMGRSINSGSCCFNYCGPRNVISGSNAWICDTENGPVWEVGIDIREGLRHKLDAMSEAGNSLEKWIKPPFLWLLHYMDSKVNGFDYRAINKERISMLPEDVRVAISGGGKE